MRLLGKRAIITAGGSGIGKAAVERFVKEGASVVAIDIDRAKLAQLEAEAEGKVKTITADLLDPENAKRAIADAVSAVGGLDILWNNAGFPGRLAVEDLELEDYVKTMDLNVRTPLFATAAALPHIRAAGGGAILFTASVAGIKGGPSASYSAAKFAVVGLGRSLARKYAKENIRVNTICPGPIETPMLPQFMDPKADPDAARAMQENLTVAVPMGRVGRPEEVAAAGAWLASDDASFVTGVFLPVDGGLAA